MAGVRTTARALDRPLEAVLLLRPNGDHWVTVRSGDATFLLHRGQLDRLEHLIAAARGEIEADGHRSNDRLHMQPVKLGPF